MASVAVGARLVHRGGAVHAGREQTVATQLFITQDRFDHLRQGHMIPQDVLPAIFLVSRARADLTLDHQWTPGEA